MAANCFWPRKSNYKKTNYTKQKEEKMQASKEENTFNKHGGPKHLSFKKNI